MRYVILCAALLAGCQTAEDLRTMKPEAVLTSTKPMTEVADCIHNAWANVPLALAANPQAALLKPEPNRINLQLREAPFLAAMADLEPTATGTRTTFYIVALKQSAGYAEETARRCQ